MRKMFIATMAGLALTLLSPPPATAADVESLRGGVAMTEQGPAAGLYKVDQDQAQIPRNFPEQPPLVPHKVAKYRTNLKYNICLSCHDKSRYEEKESPMVGKSHYMGVDGKETETINMGRYFCLQCHVPQIRAKPLVVNTFEKAE
jgi:nitrate reductase (cytochrome), electron transfer subunit